MFWWFRIYYLCTKGIKLPTVYQWVQSFHCEVCKSSDYNLLNLFFKIMFISLRVARDCLNNQEDAVYFIEKELSKISMSSCSPNAESNWRESPLVQTKLSKTMMNILLLLEEIYWAHQEPVSLLSVNHKRKDKGLQWKYTYSYDTNQKIFFCSSYCPMWGFVCHITLVVFLPRNALFRIPHVVLYKGQYNCTCLCLTKRTIHCPWLHHLWLTINLHYRNETHNCAAKNAHWAVIRSEHLLTKRIHDKSSRCPLSFTLLRYYSALFWHYQCFCRQTCSRVAVTLLQSDDRAFSISLTSRFTES